MKTNTVTVKFKKLHPDAVIPKYAHEGDAGMDISSLEEVTLHRGTPTLVRTGIAAEIPEGYELQVRPRSGLASRGVTVWNAPGTVDSGYRGEIRVLLMYLHNECIELNDGLYPKEYKTIGKGARIAQLVLAPVTRALPVETDELTATERGTRGFGSTGT